MGDGADMEGTLRLEGVHVPAALLAEATGVRDSTGLVRVDIAIAAGRIHAIEASAGGRSGRMIWPCPVDLHTHLDKGHIWPRSPNPDGTFMGALDTVGADRRARWTTADVRARFEFGLRCAYAHGTTAIRTHLDSIQPQAPISFAVFAEMREAWAGKLTLQAVSLAMTEHYAGALGSELADLVAAHGGVLGLVPLMAPDLPENLDSFFRLAADRGLDVDMHIDETHDPESRTLKLVAEAAIRARFAGQIVCGHCCSLAIQEADEAKRTLDLVAGAGIGIVSLPMCNMYLQDRSAGRTPRWRGITLAHEIRARGIPMAFASDNCRDPFYAYGDLDLHEVFREAVRIAQLDHPLGAWPAAVGTVPADLMRLPQAGRIAVGGPADLILFEGRTWSEVLSRPETGRTVLRQGRPIDTTPPAYADLDHLYA